MAQVIQIYNFIAFPSEQGQFGRRTGSGPGFEEGIQEFVWIYFQYNRADVNCFPSFMKMHGDHDIELNLLIRAAVQVGEDYFVTG